MIILPMILAFAADSVRYEVSYPEGASEAGVGASCIMYYDVSAAGLAENACIACRTYPETGQAAHFQRRFEEASLELLTQWRWGDMPRHVTPLIVENDQGELVLQAPSAVFEPRFDLQSRLDFALADSSEALPEPDITDRNACESVGLLQSRIESQN